MSGDSSYSAEPALGPGTVVAGRYEIIRLIGEGSFGEVYLARNSVGGEVVVKLLKREFNDREEAVRRFLREPRAAASVPSQHIVQVTDANTVMKEVVVKGKTVKVPDYHFIVMERLRGEDLSETLVKSGRIEPRQALHIILAVLDGLHDVHALGIVHRDLKPENIFLVTQKRSLPGVKIMDFGIAHSSADPDESRLTRDGSSMGTPAYMAPEQWQNPTGVDHRADIYAVGVILYELLEGVLPFDGATAEAAMLASVSQAPRSMVIADADLQAIAFKAMRVEPNQRFQTAAEMVQTLEEYARRHSLLPEMGNSTPATPPTPSARPQAETGLAFVSDMSVVPLRRTRPLLVALVAAALTCGVVLGVITFGGRRSSPPTRTATSAAPVPIPTTPVTPVPGPVVEPPAPAPAPVVARPVAPPPIAQPVVEVPPPPRRHAARGHRRRNNTPPSSGTGGCRRGPDGENICD